MSIRVCKSFASIVSATQLDNTTSSNAVALPVVLRLPVGLVGGKVGPGNLPEDVENVQKLLNISREKIGVPKVELVVDGKCGPKTIGAISEFQDSQMNFHDGIVEPGKTTIRRLNEIAAGGGGFGAMKQSAMEAVPLAMTWVAGATAALARLNSAIIKSTPNNPDVQVINRHFHFDRLKTPADFYLNKVRNVFRLSADVLSNGARYFQEGAGDGFADAPMGGYHFKNSPQFNHITIRREFPPCGPNAKSAMLVHECAHFVGFVNEIRHFAMEFPAPDGQAQDGSRHNYSQLTPDEAVLNASSYAAYAIHAATGQDSRFGLGNQNV